MRLLICILTVSVIFIGTVSAQIDVEQKVEDEAYDRAESEIDEGIDAGFDKVEEGIESIFRKENKDKEKQDEEAEEEDESSSSGKTSAKTEKGKQEPALTWNKYDFIPGDKVLFEDNQENEQNGEFPSRWDLAEGGGVENAVFGTDNVIYFREAGSCIVPFIKNSEKDYLPDVFTLEFDCWYEVDEYCHYAVLFYDQKNQGESSIDLSPIVIQANHVGLYGKGEGFYPGKTDEGEITNSFWRHVAISFNIRALKVYLDDARVLNIPNLGINPEGITICCDPMNTAGAEGINRFVKNVRLAQGGVKLYDKLLSDGKIVTNGIRFDVNKATIRPESMGVLNSIYQMMQEHPELKFSVEGHTDSDGDDAYNQKLSEQRAKAVADKLTTMGIDASRFTSKGWGESKPIDSNGTSEGKANNRRVEFIKM